MKFYITFGQKHTHSINGKTLDKDCVAVINCENETEGNKLAFEWLDGIFHEHTTKLPNMEYFPRGLIEIN